MVSTDVDCAAMTELISPFALLKYGSSSPADTISIATIFPSLMVTATVMVLLNPWPEPVYVPSFRLEASIP